MLMRSPVAAKRRFCLVLVKPTHYCDDGYPIRWYLSAVPSNSLACIYSIAKDFGERKTLGEDVDLEIRIPISRFHRSPPTRLKRTRCFTTTRRAPMSIRNGGSRRSATPRERERVSDLVTPGSR
jgi:hypothetical protein